MATIKDIAREANVTPTTVSNVINGNHARVSQKTIDKVQAIISKYHYIPNLTARSLVSSASRIIGVVMPDYLNTPRHPSADPFQGELLSSIEHAVQQNGYYLMIRSVRSAADIQALLQHWNVDGVLILGLGPRQATVARVPTVFIDSHAEDPSALNVGLEDRQGGYLATSHLLRNGHRHIGFVSYGIGDSGVVAERFRGYRQALQEYGRPCREQYLFDTDFQRLLPKLKEITAFFCTADLLAVELMAFLRQQQIRIPDDISLVGFDDLYLARIVTPALTTIRQDLVQKGMTAVQLLVDAIQDKAIAQRQIVLPVTLVERDSVKALRPPPVP